MIKTLGKHGIKPQPLKGLYDWLNRIVILVETDKRKKIAIPAQKWRTAAECWPQSYLFRHGMIEKLVYHVLADLIEKWAKSQFYSFSSGESNWFAFNYTPPDKV